EGGGEPGAERAADDGHGRVRDVHDLQDGDIGLDVLAGEGDEVAGGGDARGLEVVVGHAGEGGGGGTGVGDVQPLAAGGDVGQGGVEVDASDRGGRAEQDPGSLAGWVGGGRDVDDLQIVT